MKRSYTNFVERLTANGLLAQIEKHTLKKHVTLLDLYKGKHSPSVVAARKSVYTWLTGEGWGLNEVARLFDRAPSGVFKMTRAK